MTAIGALAIIGAATRHDGLYHGSWALLGVAFPILFMSYRPLQWQPHLTVAMAIDVSQRAAARHFAERPFESFTLTFDCLDFFSWPPVSILRTLSLPVSEEGSSQNS